jgi:hypothetical protein
MTSIFTGRDLPEHTDLYRVRKGIAVGITHDTVTIWFEVAKMIL